MARPDLSYLKNVFLFLSGLPLGLLTGLTAVSGSVFGVPTVRRLLGLHPARAVGVGLTLSFFAALAGILSYAQHGEVYPGLALALFVFQTVGSLGAERLRAAGSRLERFSILWGTLVTVGGLTMLAQGLGYLHGLPLLRSAGLLTPQFYGVAALLAAGAGFMSRMFGLGGVLLVPAAIYGLGLPPHIAQGTALVVLVLASLPGMLVHLQRGDVETQAATWLSAGSVLGALSGALIAVTDCSDRTLIVLFGLLLTALGLLMLRRRDSAEPV